MAAGAAEVRRRQAFAVALLVVCWPHFAEAHQEPVAQSGRVLASRASPERALQAAGASDDEEEVDCEALFSTYRGNSSSLCYSFGDRMRLAPMTDWVVVGMSMLFPLFPAFVCSYTAALGCCAQGDESSCFTNRSCRGWSYAFTFFSLMLVPLALMILTSFTFQVEADMEIMIMLSVLSVLAALPLLLLPKEQKSGIFKTLMRGENYVFIAPIFLSLCVIVGGMLIFQNVFVLDPDGNYWLFPWCLILCIVALCTVVLAQHIRMRVHIAKGLAPSQPPELVLSVNDEKGRKDVPTLVGQPVEVIEVEEEAQEEQFLEEEEGAAEEQEEEFAEEQLEEQEYVEEEIEQGGEEENNENNEGEHQDQVDQVFDTKVAL